MLSTYTHTHIYINNKKEKYELRKQQNIAIVWLFSSLSRILTWIYSEISKHTTTDWLSDACAAAATVDYATAIWIDFVFVLSTDYGSAAFFVCVINENRNALRCSSV